MMMKHTPIENTMRRIDIELTLTETLEKRGFRHEKTASSANTGAHDVFGGSGQKVFTGRADQVWDWLHSPESS